MDSNGSEIRKTQQEREKTKMDSNGREIRKTQQEREEMEPKTPEARLKIVKELVRKTREERKNMEQKTQEQGTRMMNKVAAHISVRSESDTDSFEGCEKSIEEREKMVQKIQRLTTRVMQKVAARYPSYNSFAGYDKMEQRARIQKLIQKQLTTRQSDFYTFNRFEGDKKSKWVDDDNARSAVEVCFAGVHITGTKTKMIDMEDDYSCWEDDYSCLGFNGFVPLGRVDPYLTYANVMKARSADNARSAARLYFDRFPRLRKDDDVSFKQPCKRIDMEDDYNCWGFDRLVSLKRVDPFPDETYVDVMKERALISLEEWLVEETLFFEGIRERMGAVQEEEPKKSKKRNRCDK